MKDLQDFLRAGDARATPEQRRELEERDARRAGVDLEAWRLACGAELDMALVRALHRAVCAGRAKVRRADREGRWVLAEPRPGELRTKPQSFRGAEHAEPAWDQGAIKAGVTRLLHETRPMLAAHPVRAVARLIGALIRGQPFVGLNERLALALASSVLRGIDLPGLPVHDVEHAPAFLAAVQAWPRDAGAELERYIDAVVWQEALLRVEHLEAIPASGERWTMRDEHERLSRLRADGITTDAGDAEAVAARAVELLVPLLRRRTTSIAEPAAPAWIASPAARLVAASTAAARGRAICPHAPILVAEVSVGVAEDLRAITVLAATGRGVSGAMSVHLSIEASGIPPLLPAPGLLLLPGERRAAMLQRVEAWIGGAVTEAIQRCRALL